MYKNYVAYMYMLGLCIKLGTVYISVGKSLSAAQVLWPCILKVSPVLEMVKVSVGWFLSQVLHFLF